MSLRKRGSDVGWAAVAGRWDFKGVAGSYLGPDANVAFPHGVALSSFHLRNGAIQATLQFPSDPAAHEGRIVFGYSPSTRNYYSSGVGGYGNAYVIDEFVANRGWHALGAAGSKANIEPGQTFALDVKVRGQRVTLSVGGVKVVQVDLPRPFEDDIVGLFAAGPGSVKFSNFSVTSRRPKVFVVMQYGEPFDAVYTDVIKPVSDEMGLDAYRADDVHKPGVILKDIITGLVEAEIIVAEITPPNPNVFYELGYAHAIDKTTILLAERGSALPFDISSYRVIFYDNTIKGKRNVEDHLRKHLSSILREA